MFWPTPRALVFGLMAVKGGVPGHDAGSVGEFPGDGPLGGGQPARRADGLRLRVAGPEEARQVRERPEAIDKPVG